MPTFSTSSFVGENITIRDDLFEQSIHFRNRSDIYNGLAALMASPNISFSLPFHWRNGSETTEMPYFSE